MLWGPARRAAQHPAYPARPAPGQRARSREGSRARRPADRTTKRGGRAGCSSLPVYSAARVTEILPTPASCGLRAQPRGQWRPDQQEPLHPAPGAARSTPGSAGSRVLPPRKLGQVPHNLPADPASPTPPRRRTTARGTRKPTARRGPPSRARPRQRRTPPCPARPWRGRRRRGSRTSRSSVPSSRPRLRPELRRTPQQRVSLYLRPRLWSEAAGARGRRGRARCFKGPDRPGLPALPAPFHAPGTRSRPGGGGSSPARRGSPASLAGPQRRAGKRETVPSPPPRRLSPAGPLAAAACASRSAGLSTLPIPLLAGPAAAGRGGGGLGRPDPERAAPTSADCGHSAGRAGGQAAGPPAAHEARLGLAGRAPTAGRTGNSIQEPEKAAGAAHASGNLSSHTGPDAQ